jgi:hypothetical protein
MYVVKDIWSILKYLTGYKVIVSPYSCRDIHTVYKNKLGLEDAIRFQDFFIHSYPWNNFFTFGFKKKERGTRTATGSSGCAGFTPAAEVLFQ